ncbi:GNAT family N-acetyltransferase [Flammeovirga kamogawensis]|uniref:GNAT family N-acetyltransferase n=1 Tax=Flammeovirga kamogawensis TaxID=373891 RepID=A0ABX8GW51_9BACT|nr:GNAT family N-acetyltransferase [Flammeovirga kamogawensis]MBB6461054.1 putative GNAT family N-acyltransferase [Flammeovirga kamogawensis]QWG07624.1 GNAT family N-acetyltransferase [Flammeovirga kamogawensis]TRX69434.1 GNAT family N-acetyltransferase [Flammeovirga kamogawensis]
MIIKEVTFNSPEHKLAVNLRSDVLRKPLGLEFSEEELSEEFDSYHLVAMNDADEVVACLVLKPISPQEIKMRQVAVRDDQRGKGLGSLMVQFSEIFAFDNGFESMTLHAREVAEKFYNKLDYEKVGDLFEEVGIPHYKFKKKLV